MHTFPVAATSADRMLLNELRGLADRLYELREALHGDALRHASRTLDHLEDAETSWQRYMDATRADTPPMIGGPDAS